MAGSWVNELIRRFLVGGSIVTGRTGRIEIDPENRLDTSMQGNFSEQKKRTIFTISE